MDNGLAPARKHQMRGRADRYELGQPLHHTENNCLQEIHRLMVGKEELRGDVGADYGDYNLGNFAVQCHVE